MANELRGTSGRNEQASDLSRGTNQSGVRLYNERLVLSLIRRHQAIPKAEIARLSGLSAQTVSVIVRQLESEGLLQRNEPQRGKVGQPLVPFALNPDGAFTIGLKVGRRSGELVLLDLSGKIRKSIRRPYKFPTPENIVEFARTGVAGLTGILNSRQKRRISGFGIATPFEIWNWEKEAGAPPGGLAVWRNFDLKCEVERLFDWPVHYCNDATAACAAELLFGKGQELRDYAYFYIGFFAGGGLVLNGSLHHGISGNAGALGSMPIPAKDGTTEQLFHVASLYGLEEQLKAAGQPPDMIWRDTFDWATIDTVLNRWLETAATGLAFASAAVACVVEPAAVVIDGALPPGVRSNLVSATRRALARVNMQGISPFELVEGTIGSDARAMGAASLPLFANFIIDRDVLFKEPV